MALDKLLKVRAAAKKRKPTYKRPQSHQFAKLSETKWRRPKGMGHKDRRNRRGKIGMVEVGYGSPKQVKGLNKAGLKEVIVSNVSDLKKVDAKTDIAVISSTVGGKKKLAILTQAKTLKVAVSNVKDVDKKISTLTKETSKKGHKNEVSSEKVPAKKTEAKVEKKETKSKEGKKE